MSPEMIFLICGDVSAGVRIFSPPRFLGEEPRGDERQGLMMMPARPSANFIIGQARLALGPLQAIFDSMLRLCHARQLRERRLWGGVGKMVVVFERIVGLNPLAGDKQQFLGACSASWRSPSHGA